MRKTGKNKGMGTKGQMEIMGLVVIVLLVTIGMFFVIRFVVFGEDDDMLKGYTQTQSAANFLSTLRKTTTDCDNLNIEQLVQTCVKDRQKICPGGKYVCDYTEDRVRYLLENTLVAWGNKSFYFRSYLSSNEVMIDIENRGCSEGDPGDLKQEFIPTSVGIVTTELKICD